MFAAKDSENIFQTIIEMHRNYGRPPYVNIGFRRIPIVADRVNDVTFRKLFNQFKRTLVSEQIYAALGYCCHRGEL